MANFMRKNSKSNHIGLKLFFKVMYETRPNNDQGMQDCSYGSVKFTILMAFLQIQHSFLTKMQNHNIHQRNSEVAVTVTVTVTVTV
jgi:hypothetical protein